MHPYSRLDSCFHQYTHKLSSAYSMQACLCTHALTCGHAPFLISFQERAEVFTTVVGQDRMEQRELSMQSGHGWGRQFFVTIHRTSLLQVCALLGYMLQPGWTKHFGSVFTL